MRYVKNNNHEEAVKRPKITNGQQGKEPIRRSRMEAAEFKHLSAGEHDKWCAHAWLICGPASATEFALGGQSKIMLFPRVMLQRAPKKL